MKKLSLAIFIFLLAAMTAASAQSQSSVPTNAAVATDAMTVSRTTKAVHYRLQGGSTKVNFRGTDQLQRASGEARVEGKKTNFEIDAKFEGLEDATKFGLEFLTYVAWAVSPQGRPVNLGELSLDQHGSAHRAKRESKARRLTSKSMRNSRAWKTRRNLVWNFLPTWRGQFRRKGVR